MGQREDIVAKAVSQIGYKEQGNNRTKFGAWYGLDGNPWCQMFVSWCAAQAGIDEDIVPKLSYVPYCVSFFKRAGRYKAKGSYIPKPGDIIFYGTSSHVGLVEKVVGSTVYAIEGNTSAGGNNSNGEGVYRRQRALTNSWIMGYGVPDYKEEEEVEKKDLKITLADGCVTSVEHLLSVMLDNENWVRLRDIAPALGWEVGYDAASKSVKLDKMEE